MSECFPLGTNSVKHPSGLIMWEQAEAEWDYVLLAQHCTLPGPPVQDLISIEPSCPRCPACSAAVIPALLQTHWADILKKLWHSPSIWIFVDYSFLSLKIARIIDCAIL